MYVEEFGSEDAPTVLFLHGGMVAGWMWAGQAEALTDFHCLVPDMPGFGESYDDPWVSLAETAVSLSTLIAEKAHGGKAHIVGLSLGAVMALHLATHAPERIDRIILSGTLTRPMTGPLVTVQKLMLSLYHTTFGARLIAGMFRIPPDGIEAFMRTAKLTPKITNQRAIDEIYAKPLPDGLTAVNHPTLVVSGTKDMAITREGVPTLAETLPNAVGYMVPNVGHTWNAEDPYLFNEMMSAWLNDNRVPASLKPVGVIRHPTF
ncbi:MAG: alpha/beta hydrolase [Chloroflexi bacterium]|nr:alpha/beta hydrolase [Chloroflexota bacterium]